MDQERQERRKHGHSGEAQGLLCLLLTLLSAAWLLALVALQRFCPETNLFGFLAAYVPAPPLLVPLLVSLALSLALRRWLLVAGNAGLLIAGVLLLMPPVLPTRDLPPDDPATRVRLVTWNTHEQFRDTARMRAVIAELKPDILCLQEARRGDFADLLPGAQVAHTHEVTTLTTGRILTQRPLPLGRRPNFRWGLDTDIVLPQGRVRVLNVHYMIDINRRLRYARQRKNSPPIDGIQLSRMLENEVVVDWLRSTAGPRVVLGDFNTPPSALIYRQLAAVATNAFAVAGRGWGFTFRRDRPVTRIDHAWCAGGVQPLWAAARDGGVSDHRLLVTDILLPKPAPSATKATSQPSAPEATARRAVSGTPEDTR